MPKIKYRYNPATLLFEKIEFKLQKIIFRILGFTCFVIVCSIMLIFLAYNYIDSPKEKLLKREISELLFNYELLNKRLNHVSAVLADLQERDDNIYRIVFEADPISVNVREAGFGGIDKYKELEGFSNTDLLIETTKKLDKVAKQAYIQSKSYDEVYKMITNRTNFLASIPAIQPISNKDLTRLASGFGYRIHPIYKTTKMHTGMDFTAPFGTNIYSTGNGTIKEVEWSLRGYGNHIVIDHGNGYETIYAHLGRLIALKGQKVKRGDLIGTVGNTGLSVGPHLHYEVIKNGVKVNPINYYFNDLSPEEYEKMLEISSRHNQSFD